jgi:NADH-quinone oxidoreductase subunit I
MQIDHKPTWVERTYLPEVLRGLSVTIGHFSRNLSLHIAHLFGAKRDTPAAVTIQYPDVQADIKPRFRGVHRLTVREDGNPACVACMCCETACGFQAIDIVAVAVDDPSVEKRPASFEINYGRCTFCGLCVDACPCDAIRMDTAQFDLSCTSREDLIWGLDKLMANHKGEGTEVFPPIDHEELAPRWVKRRS